MDNEEAAPLDDIKKSKVMSKKNFIYLAVLISLIATSTVSILYTVDVNKKYEEMQNKIDAVSSNIDATPKIVKKDIDDVINKLDSRITRVEMSNYIDGMEHRVEGGVVTDSFVVAKISILALPSIGEGSKGLLMTTIDLDTQPLMSSKYIGQGNFNIPDRELRASILEIISKLEAEYSGTNDLYKDLPKWNEGSHHVTIKNYEIGALENGVLKLKGE